MRIDRRTLLASAGTSAVLLACSRRSAGDDEVTPAEDLMREHGVLRRVMYMYDDAAQRLDQDRELPFDALAGCADIIRRVIEDYHEKLEEDFLFPRYEKAGKLAELTATLRKQHQAGRAYNASAAEPDCSISTYGTAKENPHDQQQTRQRRQEDDR